MSNPSNYLDDLAAKIDEEKQAVMAKYVNKVRMVLEEAFFNAKSVDPKLTKVDSSMGTAALYGEFANKGGEFTQVSRCSFEWRNHHPKEQPTHPETQRLLDLLATYDSLLPHELPEIGDIE